MHLANLHLAAAVIEALERHGIFTAEEILLITDDELYKKMSNSLSIQQLEVLRQEVRRKLSAPGIRASELFADEQKKEFDREKCYSGIPSLDSLLDGFGMYGVLEIAGSGKSGRTELVLNIALRHMASQTHHKTVWFDVGGEFDIERTQMILAMHCENPVVMERILENFSIITCFDIAAIYEHIRHLEILLREETHNSRTRFIIIDSLTSLLVPLLSATPSQGHVTGYTLMRLLTSLARTYSLTVLIINDVTQLIENKTLNTPLTSALGPSFAYHTDAALWLSTADHPYLSLPRQGISHYKERLFKAEVLHSHNSVSQGRWCCFTMRNGMMLQSIVMDHYKGQSML